MRNICVAAAMVLLAVFFLSAACLHHKITSKKNAHPKHLYPVRVFESARSPYFLPQYLAVNLGFFEEEGLSVSIYTTSQGAIRSALAGGRADIVLCGLQNILPRSKAVEPHAQVFAALGTRDGSFLLKRAGDGWNGWQELWHGSVIGSSHDVSSQIALEAALRRHGLRPYRDVAVYYNIPESLRLSAFCAGTGSAIQLLEPQASLAEQNGAGRVVASVGEATGEMLVTAYAASPVYIENNPQIIQSFTNAIMKAQLWLAGHSDEEAAAVTAPFFPSLDKETLLKCITRYRSLGIWKQDPTVPQGPFDNFVRAAKAAGEIAAEVPYEKMVAGDFAQKAALAVTLSAKESR